MAEPPRRKTIEVDVSWLEEVPASKQPAAAAPAPTRKKPPRMPGATVTVPPLPARGSEPPTEVEMEWVELVDNEVAKPKK
jgi:hypothetical protein